MSPAHDPGTHLFTESIKLPQASTVVSSMNAAVGARDGMFATAQCFHHSSCDLPLSLFLFSVLLPFLLTDLNLVHSQWESQGSLSPSLFGGGVPS